MICLDNTLIPMTWGITVVLGQSGQLVQGDDLGACLDRIRVWLDYVLDSSVLASVIDKDLIQQMPVHGGCHFLPAEPNDYILALCMYAKINSMLEGKMGIESISLQNSITDDSFITVNKDALVDLQNTTEPGYEEVVEYWFKKDPVFFQFGPDVDLKLKSQTWEEIGITFDPSTHKPDLDFSKFDFSAEDDDEDTDSGQLQ